ncbi:MAG TPA: PAS domain-containing protein, partial [bacterium]
PGRPAGDKQRAVEEDRAVMEGQREAKQFEGIDYTQTGKALHFLSFKAPLRDEAGNVTGLVGVVVDTTGIKHAEEELRKSQALLQTVFNTFPYPLVVKDRAGRYLMVNAAWSALSGAPAEQALHRMPEDITSWSNADASAFQREDQVVMSSGKVQQFEGFFYNSHGERRRYESIKAPLPDDSGQARGVVGLFVDVTDQYDARHKADVAHARLSDAIESLPAAFFLYDAEERLVLWNSIVGEFFPHLYGRLQPGMTFREILSGTAPQIVEAEGDPEGYVNRRVAQFRHNPGQFEQRYKSGRWIQGVDRRTADGGTVSLRFDVTDLKNREAELRQAQKMEVVGQLTGGVAHDLNNLLQVISGSLLIAQRGMDKAAPGHDLFSTALDACMRAADLTQQLLAFSRKQVLRLQPLDVNEVLQGFRGMVTRVLPSSITVRVVPVAGLMEVHADRGLMEQVLMNLAVNARDAMPHGGTLTFETEARVLDASRLRDQPWARPGAFVALRVKDTGEGMAPDVLEHIFEPFYTTKPVGKGTGLGLSTVYGIVQQHSGAIEVQSVPGTGTEFTIYWPARVAAGGRPAEAAVAPTLRGSESILMVDDNSAVSAVLSDSLVHAGYRVKILSSGAEALRYVTEGPAAVDVVLLDLMMPEMSGIECYQRLMDIRADLPVLFCSGWASPENEAFLTSRGLPMLTKPATPDQLLRAVRSLLDHKVLGPKLATRSAS